jgi:hypothetical protein
VPRNVTLNKAWRFTRACRLHFHAAIYKCFDDFNHTNGKVVVLQNGSKMNMAKAIILAVYCERSPSWPKIVFMWVSLPPMLHKPNRFLKTTRWRYNVTANTWYRCQQKEGLSLDDLMFCKV